MKSYVRVTLLYLGLGVLWILFSDRAASAVASDNIDLLNILQTVKGWLFVGGSGLFLFFITRKASHQESNTDSEKREIYNETVQGVYHIVFNYINNMQMVLMEAERCDEFSKETLDLARVSARTATEELRNLQNISVITAAQIHSVLYARMEGAQPPKNGHSIQDMQGGYEAPVTGVKAAGLAI